MSKIKLSITQLMYSCVGNVEYTKESEPDKRDKGYAWHTAIGLQAASGITMSRKKNGCSGTTVLYGSATELHATLDYDFSEEKKFSYRNLSMDEIIRHLAEFISGLWQIYLEIFLRNLLLNEKHPLHNRTLRRCFGRKLQAIF